MPSFFTRSKNGSDLNWGNHPDLPISPRPPPARSPNAVNRSTSVSGYTDRRSAIPGANEGLGIFAGSLEEHDLTVHGTRLSHTGSGAQLGRSQTTRQNTRDSARASRSTTASGPIYGVQGSPSPTWPPEAAQSQAHNEGTWSREDTGVYNNEAPMSGGYHHAATPAGKTSSESTLGPTAGLDRFTQRRLQRLNTEQGFREQRQGGQAVTSPPLPAEQSSSSIYNSPGAQQNTAPQPETQPQRTGPLQPTNNPPGASSRSSNYQHIEPLQPQVQSQSQFNSQPDPALQYQPQERPTVASSRSYGGVQQQQQQQQQQEEPSMATTNNAPIPATKGLRTGTGNRQSIQNGLNLRDAPAPGFGYTPPAVQPQKSGGDAGSLPGPPRPSTPMSEVDVEQLVKDHKELREKYTKVKKYYFEKEDQVKQLQNSLAHQRLSQSRTSLDDSEYTTRFNRLDGLIAQLAFSIRKSWRSIPGWLNSSVNKDAVATGKQEMTAVGRAFISCWLVEEVFNKYFHPDLEPTLSAMLKNVQQNIRKNAPAAQTVEEEDFLTSKVVNWRLATLEGLQDAFRAPNCAAFRAQLTDALKDGLIRQLTVHLQEPAPSDLEGGVHMIIELVVSILIHLPMESRDVVIEYFMPSHNILPEQMKMESGIPALTHSVTDDQADRASMKSAQSDLTDLTENNGTHAGETGHKSKRSMLSALTGSGGKTKSAPAQGKHAGAGGSSSSLGRPESAAGKDDLPPRVRMAAGIGVQIRGRGVLVKAPVFST